MSKKLTPIAKLVRKTGRLLLDPKKRCTGKPAADRAGIAVDIFSDRAEKFCLVGALGRTVNDDWGPTYRAVREKAAIILGTVYLVSKWDDNTPTGRTSVAKKLAAFKEYE